MNNLMNRFEWKHVISFVNAPLLLKGLRSHSIHIEKDLKIITNLFQFTK